MPAGALDRETSLPTFMPHGSKEVSPVVRLPLFSPTSCSHLTKFSGHDLYECDFSVVEVHQGSAD